MKSLKYLALIIISCFFVTLSVNATECDYQTQAKLNNLASQVKTNYEVKSERVDPSTYNTFDGTPSENIEIYNSYLEVNIINISPEIYLVLKNENDNSIKYVYYNDTEGGIYTFEHRDTEELTNYNIEIYAMPDLNCSADKIRVVSLKLPKKNEYHDYAVCEGLENFSYCEEFILFEEPKIETIIEKTNKYKETGIDEIKEEQKEKNAFISFINDNKIVIIISTVSVIVIGGVVVITLKNKKRRKSHEEF